MFAASYANRASAAHIALGAGSAASMQKGNPLMRGKHTGLRGTCVVRLIDRRTGLTHKVGGSPLVIFTRDPALAANELLEGRDSAIWEVRIDPIEP